MGNGVCNVAFDRRDIAMNKLGVSTLESQLVTYDLRTYHPEEGYAGVRTTVAKATVWGTHFVPQKWIDSLVQVFVSRRTPDQGRGWRAEGRRRIARVGQFEGDLVTAYRELRLASEQDGSRGHGRAGPNGARRYLHQAQSLLGLHVLDATGTGTGLCSFFSLPCAFLQGRQCGPRPRHLVGQ